VTQRVKPSEQERLRPSMARHIRELGFKSATAYQNWCRKAGVSPSFEKGPEERATEVEIIAREKAAIAAHVRMHRNPRQFIKDACAGLIDPSSVERPGWREVVEAISRDDRTPDERQGLADFLLHLEHVSDLVFEPANTGQVPAYYIDGLIRLHKRRRQWIRPVSEWRPGRHNPRRQFSSLARHLLAKFDVPLFLDSAWLRGDRGAHRFRDWFIHIGGGHNIRTAKTLYPMTKMTAHHFVHASDDVTIEGALLLADVLALGGTQRLASALAATRLGMGIERDPQRRAFWLSVYRFFIANPMLDLRHAGPIIDFLAFQKFETQEVMIGPGEAEIRQPTQPNLTMTRRTPESLLRQVEAWHGELRLIRANDKRYWKPSGVRGFAMRTGPKDRPDEQTYWKLRELLSGQELIDEGRRLKHCVATYARSCARGACSIWSLQRQRGLEDRGTPMLTIEIDAKGTVVQARGLSNRWPSAQEKAVLDAWMREAGLRSGPFVYGL